MICRRWCLPVHNGHEPAGTFADAGMRHVKAQFADPNQYPLFYLELTSVVSQAQQHQSSKAAIGERD